MTGSPQAWPERIDPLATEPGIVAHHLKKYEFALTYVTGMVIDVACGVGYGTHHLGGSVDRAVGLDLDASAIQIAR